MPRRTFSCFLIGGNSLLVSCAELLLEQGHEVLGVVSPDEGIRDWAARQGLDAVDADQDLTAYLSARPFDYLFSVANLRMLPEAVLSLPRELPVNFHDAPLPRHAGLNATTWAILGGETLHGVSWHVMTERADAGDLLARREVPVSERDTSHTLNVKCLEAGVESFAELIEDLALGRAERHPQNPAGRNYHGRFDRPAGGGFLSWDRTPQELDATVRAMEFGPHPNAFGTAKIACDDGPVLVHGSEILPHSSRRAPGTVVETGDDGIVVATTGRDLRLTGLTTPTGRPLPAAALAARRIRPGHRLPAADAPLLEAASGAQRRSLRDEAFWVRRLSRLTPADLPHRRTSPTGTDGTPLRHLVPVPDDGDRAAHATGLDRAQWLLTASLAFLARLGVESGTDVRLLHTGHLTGHPVVDALYAPAVPLRVPEVADRTMSACGTQVVRELETVVRRSGPAHDLATRHRATRDRRPALTDLPLAVELTEDMTEPAAPPAGAALLIRIPLRDGPCQWVFAEDAFGHEEAALTAEHAAAFLHAAAHAPHAELDGIALGSDARRAELAAWNDTTTDFPLDLCVHRMVTRQARLCPDAPAVVCGGRTLTYGDLDRRSSDLAGLLRARGAGPGTRVGVCLSRSPELVVALLAVMKSGAAYVPLDPLYPAERIAYMATDTALPLLITDPGAARGLPALTAGLLLLDRDRPATAAYAPEPGADVASGTDAYVIYTSGSTGHPKGVRISHRALTNFVCAMSDAPGFTDRDRLLAVTTVCFDIAGLELYLPLVTGGQVEIASAGTAADGFRLRELLESSLPTVMQATPATWRMLIEAGWRGQPHGAPLRILCGGERLPTDLADALLSRGARLWNMYGPTETTIWSAVTPVTSAERTSIGRPIANTRLHVLDARRRPLPTGVPGELYIGGEGVAAGYLNRPELTAQRFVPDVLGGRPGATLYRTGDLVRHLPDGRLEFLGRVDNQVKLHGYRIEPGEIEAALRTHPSVAEAVVVVREDVPGDRRLVGYVVPVPPGPGVRANVLRGHLRDLLPGYMIPGTFVELPRIPLTANGKTDRAALPAPSAASPGGPDTATGSATEQAVARIWREVLRLERVGFEDNFFDVGGNSLLLTRVMARLNAGRGRPLTRVEMFRYPTIRSLAGRLDRADDAPDEPQGPPERTRERPGRTGLGQLRRRRQEPAVPQQAAG